MRHHSQRSRVLSGHGLRSPSPILWLIRKASYQTIYSRFAPRPVFNADQRLASMPVHLASLWATLNFRIGSLRGFTAGGGIRYTDAAWDGSDMLRTPSFTLFDAMFAYDHRAWRVALNAANLADKVHVTTCLTPGDCFYGSRRTVTATISYRFEPRPVSEPPALMSKRIQQYSESGG